jgi:hypothetical protein
MIKLHIMRNNLYDGFFIISLIFKKGADALKFKIELVILFLYESWKK